MVVDVEVVDIDVVVVVRAVVLGILVALTVELESLCLAMASGNVM